MLLFQSQIFQTPKPLLILSIALFAVIGGIGITWPEKRRWWHLLIPVILAAGAIGIARFVQTDYEKIEIVIDRGIEAFARKDISQIDAIISPDYRDKVHRSKSAMMSYCRRLFSRPLAEKISKRSNKITVTKAGGESELKVFVYLEAENPYSATGMPMTVKVKMYFTKTVNGNWLISRSDLITINNRKVTWNSIR